MNVIKTIVVEDEPHSREMLLKLLKRYCPEVEVVGSAASIDEAKPLIERLKPDLVFLDVRLRDGSGFDLLNLLDPIDFHIIFTTAFEEYAVRAIRCSALDYLVKPLDIDELVASIQRLLRAESHRMKSNDIRSFAKEMATEGPPLQVGLPSQKGIEIIAIASIVRCEADGSYARVYLNNGKCILVSRNLKEMEELLVESGFIRSHRKHLINMGFVQKYIRGNGGYVVMKDGSTADVSKRMKSSFLRGINF